MEGGEAKEEVGNKGERAGRGFNTEGEREAAHGGVSRVPRLLFGPFFCDSIKP